MNVDDAIYTVKSPADHDPSDHKRGRPFEWPLGVMDGNNGKPPKQEKSPKKHCSPRAKREAVKNTRPSKFLEGSMNDRVSKKPPSLYTKDDDPIEGRDFQPDKDPSPYQGGGMDGTSTPHDVATGAPKSSGVYRFGRAIVNVFKPMTVWRGFGGNREEKDPNFLSEKSVMQERQIKAEKAYADLKKNGYKGTQPSSWTVESLAIPAVKVESATDESRLSSHRDSGIDVDGYCSPAEPEQHGQVLDLAKSPIPPPPASATRQLVSPMSNASSARKPSLHFRKPSFQNLKKVKSQIQLPAAKKQATEPGAGGGKFIVEQSLRKQPSRKDIAKQEKLSKRVSDLEAQLEVARRNLLLSRDEAPVDYGVPLYKGPRIFKPGALPSLPSERLLNKALIHAGGDEALRAEANGAVGSFTEREAALSSVNDHYENSKGDPASQLEKELVNSFNQHSLGRKRSRDSRHQDTRLATEHVDTNKAGSTVIQSDRPKRKLRSSSRIQEAEKSVDTSAELGEILEQGNVPLPPHNSPYRAVEAVPQVPAIRDSFDPSQVDQARLLSMRSIGDMTTPFGRNPEDLDNLRKEFPTVPADQLAIYVQKLPKDSKITDHASIAHHNQAVAPLLARPRSASPIKSEPRKAPKYRKSALQVSHNNSNTTSKANDTDLMGCKDPADVEFIKPPPFPNFMPVTGDRKVENDKPLPSIQKEEYEWPEDVF